MKIIMEKDALKNPLTSRNAASARLLQGQVNPCNPILYNLTKHLAFSNSGRIDANTL